MTTSIQKLITVLIFFTSVALFGAEKLTLGLTGVALKEDIVTLIQLQKYLEKKTEFKIDFKFARSYAAIESFLRNNEVDFAYVCGATYVTLQPTYSVELLVIPITDKQPLYHSIIIAKKEAPYKSLVDFKDTVFAMSDPESNSASLVPQYKLYQQGYDPSHFFKAIFYTYDHGESIDAVLSGYVDGASVDSVVYKAFAQRYPKKASKLRIVERSKAFPIPPFIVQKELSASVKKSLQKAFLDMSKDPSARKIIHSMALDGFILPQNISYRSIEEIQHYLKEKRNPL